MELPKFMIVDNPANDEDVLVLHTGFPRFIVSLVSEDIEWFDDVSQEDEDELAKELEGLIIDADNFYQAEIDKLGLDY